MLKHCVINIDFIWNSPKLVTLIFRLFSLDVVKNEFDVDG